MRYLLPLLLFLAACNSDTQESQDSLYSYSCQFYVPQVDRAEQRRWIINETTAITMGLNAGHYANPGEVIRQISIQSEKLFGRWTCGMNRNYVFVPEDQMTEHEHELFMKLEGWKTDSK